MKSLAVHIPFPLGVDETEMSTFCAEAKDAMDAILRKNKANTKTESGEERITIKSMWEAEIGTLSMFDLD